MISIKEAISKEFWIHCEATESFLTYIFHIKILSFKKLNLTEVDEPERIKLFNSNAPLWLMKLEVINFTKKSISPNNGFNNIILIDQDGFKFHTFLDTYLCQTSIFGKKIGMSRLYSAKLIPKIRAIGVITFQLPDDDEAEYCISLKSGSLYAI